jgi:hypothetical protein
MKQAHQKLLDQAQQLFGDVPRPEYFTDHSHCCECADHNNTLSAHTPETIGIDELGNMAWDPICFATEEAFLYYFPALVRLTLTGFGDSYYLDQLLFHVILDGTRNRRWQSFSPEQRAYVVELLEYMLEYRTADIDNELDADRILDAILIWQDDGN